MRPGILFSICIVMILNACSVYRQDLTIVPAAIGDEKINVNNSKAAKLKQAIDELVTGGIPGCAMAVYSEEGWWSASSGLAKIEDKTPMQMGHLQYLQSIAKTYMAVCILKLYEEDKIDLDAPMTKYLPEAYSRNITHGEKVTVRMLLNHTSGVPEYNSAPAYVSRLLQHPDHYFAPGDYLVYINGKPLDFEPGSKYSYRNTNYLILALIGDAITGDHTKYLSENILKPLGLVNTFYRGTPGYLAYPNLVNSYWDRHSDGIVENASQLQRNNVAALVGDDGIVATPVDAVKFLKGLMEGKLLSPTTLDLMKTWAKDKAGNPTYGLGLDYSVMHEKVAYGHSGGGIGAGCQLYYFPEKNLYFFVGINLGTVTDSPLHASVTKSLDKLYQTMLE